MSVERYFWVETGITLSSIAIEKLLSRIERMGMRSRTAVSKSMPVKPIAASPPQVDAEFFGFRELGAHREAEPHAELRRLAPADIAHRLGRDPEGRDLVSRAARVMRDDGVLRIDRVHQLPDDPVGIEWRLVGVEQRPPLRH